MGEPNVLDPEWLKVAIVSLDLVEQSGIKSGRVLFESRRDVESDGPGWLSRIPDALVHTSAVLKRLLEVGRTDPVPKTGSSKLFLV